MECQNILKNNILFEIIAIIILLYYNTIRYIFYQKIINKELNKSQYKIYKILDVGIRYFRWVII